MWQGAERGGLASAAPVDIRLALVPSGKDLTPAQKIGGTKLSANLNAAGADKVRAYAIEQHHQPVSVELGDHEAALKYEDNGRTRLSQQPTTRERGSLRYTAALADGTKIRYLVHTDAGKLVQGGDVLGKVTVDTDPGYK